MPAISLRKLTAVGSLLFHHGTTLPVQTSIDNSTIPSISHHQNIERRNTFDGDRRVAQLDTSSFPFSAIGVVRQPDYYCTGFLVGPRHVATAAHCYREDTPIYFSPGWNGTAPYGKYDVVGTHRSGHPRQRGAHPSDCDRRDDFIILILGENDRIGDRLGYFSVGVWNDRDNIGDAEFRSAGYPGDLILERGVNAMYRQRKIKVSQDGHQCQSDGPLNTDANLSLGQSGSPVWLDMANGNRRAYGVISGGRGGGLNGANRVETLVASGKDFEDAVNGAKIGYP